MDKKLRNILILVGVLALLCIGYAAVGLIFPEEDTQASDTTAASDTSLTPLFDVTEDGLTYLTYTNENEGVTAIFFTVAYKSGDAFWLFQFGCAASDYNRLKDDIFAYAKSVTFS